MTFSEEFPDPRASSSEDIGYRYDSDILLESPETNERVVDTQSGFLIVVKKAGERLALSIKRRIGTPPSSSVALTPDESAKLANILRGRSNKTSGRSAQTDTLLEGSDFLVYRSEEQVGKEFLPFAVSFKSAKPALIVISALLVCSIAIVAFRAITAPSKQTQITIPASTQYNPGENKIESFAHNYVQNLLDFNPETYRVSQITAMSMMSPRLLNAYWLETNFPLSSEQLASLGQNKEVIIKQITCESASAETAQVDVKAQLVNKASKAQNPVHLRLTLATNADGSIKVLQQQDLSK